MKKILLALLLTPLFAAAENYFVEGAKWIGYSYEHPFPYIYSIEGTDFKAGYECHNLYRNFPFDERMLVTVVRTEGDKVYFLHDPEATEWDLLYDFGLEEGEECEVNWLNVYVYSTWDFNPLVQHFTREATKTKVVCTKKTTLPELGGATVLYIEDVDARGEDLATPQNYWVAGIGNLSVVDNSHYHLCPAGVTTCGTFEVNGEEILRYNREGEPESSAFYPDVLWTMDKDGFEGDGKCFDEFRVCAHPHNWVLDGQTLSLQKPVKENGTDYRMKQASIIRVDGDQIYRIKYKKEVPTGLAYDFAMQQGDVREVVALESELGTPSTWVKCTERRASKAFPGRDEILLDEYADADCTELIGNGMWVTGIGSPASPLANSRFAETSAGSQLKMVSQFDKVMWDRERFGAPSLANLETVKAEDGATPGAVFYNLQGMRVDNPGNGMFIRVEGGKTSKVLLK